MIHPMICLLIRKKKHVSTWTFQFGWQMVSGSPYIYIINKQMYIIYIYIYLYALEVQRQYFKCFFRKDYWFHKGFVINNSRDYSVNSLWPPEYTQFEFISHNHTHNTMMRLYHAAQNRIQPAQCHQIPFTTQLLSIMDGLRQNSTKRLKLNFWTPIRQPGNGWEEFPPGESEFCLNRNGILDPFSVKQP